MEMQQIMQQLEEAYSGDPWFGRPVKAILAEISEEEAMASPGGQHSIVVLLWHMVNWRLFVISRLEPQAEATLHHFEQNDWLEQTTDRSLWKKGVKKLEESQNKLLQLLQNRPDELLELPVPERSYNFRKLLLGIVQHDIYHLGQIAYIAKLHRSTAG